VALDTDISLLNGMVHAMSSNLRDRVREVLHEHHLDATGDCHCGFECNLIEDWLDHVAPLLAALPELSEPPAPKEEHQWLDRQRRCSCGFICDENSALNCREQWSAHKASAATSAPSEPEAKGDLK
jgi:hypothetical protein